MPEDEVPVNFTINPPVGLTSPILQTPPFAQICGTVVVVVGAGGSV